MASVNRRSPQCRSSERSQRKAPVSRGSSAPSERTPLEAVPMAPCQAGASGEGADAHAASARGNTATMSDRRCSPVTSYAYQKRVGRQNPEPESQIFLEELDCALPRYL